MLGNVRAEDIVRLCDSILKSAEQSKQFNLVQTLKSKHYDWMSYPDFPEPPDESYQIMQYHTALGKFFDKNKIEVTDEIKIKFGY